MSLTAPVQTGWFFTVMKYFEISAVRAHLPDSRRMTPLDRLRYSASSSLPNRPLSHSHSPSCSHSLPGSPSVTTMDQDLGREVRVPVVEVGLPLLPFGHERVEGVDYVWTE